MAIATWLAVTALCLQVVTSTDRPIIGILAQEFEDNATASYIAASYVKAVESAGARVVPIFIWKSPSYYRDLIYKLNGAVLPGGAVPWNTEGGFFQTAATIYNLAKEMDKKGISFPILGVCQGFEALAMISNKMEDNTLTKCSGMDGIMLPLEFKKAYLKSSLYRDASREIIETLSTKNVTPNYHMWCLKSTTKLKEPWKILSVNKDANGMEFVSSMENGHYAGIQFHPEKCAYEWKKDNPSNKAALLAARHFYDWLVAEARKNNNVFSSTEEENKLLIYNYSPQFSGKTSSSFEQQYVFSRS